MFVTTLWQVLEPVSYASWPGRHVTTRWRCWCKKAAVWSQRFCWRKQRSRSWQRSFKEGLMSQLLPGWAPMLVHRFCSNICLFFFSPLCQFNHSPNPCGWVFPIKHFHSEDPRMSSTKNNLNLNLKLNTFHLTFSLNYSLLVNSGSPTFLIHKLYAHCEDRFFPACDRCAVCRTGQKASVIPPAHVLSGRPQYPESVCWVYPFSSCTIVKFILKRFFCVLKFYLFFFEMEAKLQTETDMLGIFV